jgi:hypothetical protein
MYTVGDVHSRQYVRTIQGVFYTIRVSPFNMGPDLVLNCHLG